MNDSQIKGSSTLAGIFLILLGVAFLAITQGAINLNWGSIWPIFPMIAGVFLLVLTFTSPNPAARSGLVFAGTIPLLLGLFFFAITLDILSWSNMGTLWPIFPLAVGVAFIIAYLVSNREHNFYLIPGASLIIIAVTFLVIFQVGGSASAIGKLWPIFLVMAGILLLVLPMIRRRAT